MLTSKPMRHGGAALHIFRYLFTSSYPLFNPENVII